MVAKVKSVQPISEPFAFSIPAWGTSTGSAGISKQKALGCGRFSFCGRSTRCSCPAGPLIHRGADPSNSPCRFASMPSGAGISRQWPWIAGVLSFAAVLVSVPRAYRPNSWTHMRVSGHFCSYRPTFWTHMHAGRCPVDNLSGPERIFGPFGGPARPKRNY